MAYCTYAEVNTYLGGGLSSDQTLIEDLIEAAQSYIDEACSRTFEASANTTRYFDAIRDVDGLTLSLDRDLAIINTITNGDGVAVSASAYVTEPRGDTPYRAIRLKASSGVVWTYDDDPENAIAISGKWAYSATAPARISQACIRLAAYLYRQKDTQHELAGQAQMTPEGNMVLPARIPYDVGLMLAPYRKRT